MLDRLVAQLEREGCTVEVATTGADAYARFTPGGGIDVVIVAMELADVDGRQWVRSYRGPGRGLPVLAIAGGCDLPDRLSWFAAGVDDCVGSPFDAEEVVARVRALARRPGPVVQMRAPVELDAGTLAVSTAYGTAPLRDSEYGVLAALLAHRNRVVTRDQLAIETQPARGSASANGIHHVVRSLRRKLRDVQAPIVITTVRGVGYRAVDVEPSDLESTAW